VTVNTVRTTVPGATGPFGSIVHFTPTSAASMTVTVQSTRLFEGFVSTASPISATDVNFRSVMGGSPSSAFTLIFTMTCLVFPSSARQVNVRPEGSQLPLISPPGGMSPTYVTPSGNVSFNASDGVVSKRFSAMAQIPNDSPAQMVPRSGHIRVVASIPA